MRAFALAAALLALAGHASASPIAFTYGFTATPTGGPGQVVVTPSPSSGPMEVESGSPTVLLAASVTDGDGVAPASPFSLSMQIRDTASGDQGELTFTGLAGGSLSFTSPLETHADLNGYRYQGTLDASLPSQLSMTLVVSELPPIIAPPFLQTPEPGSLLLALAAGLIGLGRFKTAGRPSP